MAVKNKSVQEIIEESGNSFHSRIVKLLRNENWPVLVSPYYSDNFTDKPREIDIISEKKFDVHAGYQWLGTLNIRLFIECKYINRQTIFWFDAKDRARAIERIMTDTGMKHPDDNINIEGLHYFADLPVAKLFESEKSGGEDREAMNKAVNQNLNALVYYRSRNDLIPRDRRKPVGTERKLRGVHDNIPSIAWSYPGRLPLRHLEGEPARNDLAAPPFPIVRHQNT